MLEEMLGAQNSGISDEFRLETLYILDQIDFLSSQAPTAVGGIAVLIKMAKSPSPARRAQVASKLAPKGAT